jgi:hypothetical protein
MRAVPDRPILRPGDGAAVAYVRLWDVAFGSRLRYVPGQQRLALALFTGLPDDVKVRATPARRSERVRLRLAGQLAVPRHADPPVAHNVVKSVRVTFAIDWLRERWDPVVVLCMRHPLDVVASRLRVHARAAGRPADPATRRYAMEEFGVGVPERDDAVTWAAWVTGLMMSAVDRARVGDRPPVIADHERICADPVGELRSLTEAVGLEWSPEAEQFVVESNRPGSGYELTRVAAHQPGKWQTLLTRDEAARALAALAPFPVAERYHLA